MKETYYELTISLDEVYTEFIADFVANIAQSGVELENGQIVVRSESDLSNVKGELVALEETLGNSINMSIKLEEKQNQDWIQNYQDSVQPVEAGKFYISPSWYEPKADSINIIIDPALAFGSGHHPTTFACLEAISSYVKNSDEIIDVGCGSGILGLACKKLGAKVSLCDTDPVSIENTKENFTLNDVMYDALWEGSINKTEKNYDIVIANIIPDVLRFIAKELKEATQIDGYLILSGILDKKEKSVHDVYNDLDLEKRIQIDEWVTLVYKK
ncbi:MAG: Ribosomal protein L11 methyltransferase (EC [uncultured Sulfurovum sp.]|uniref:Ribosomal protein L11 methyltransferase n=1 Tax=uncultured Sulfurovum sp. TaxID=269237 RepID=A0A6S6T8B4_9BACT|nr:MAG: Ribosomal protein L11 methyltransferase (EC [uncultured Sulfurovum sp.]